MVTAFEEARHSLSSTAVLEHPATGADLSLVTDASSTHVGAVILQRRQGQAWRPLGFFSAQLNKAQVNYSTFDRELFVVVAPIKHFRYMLEGRAFTVFTDHRPLVGAINRHSDPWSGGNSAIFLSSPSSHRPFGISPANPTWSLIPSPDRPVVSRQRCH
jgi:hypothetical protein